MAKKKKIIRYAVDGKRLIQIVNWWKYHGPVLQWARRSKYKAPPKWTDRSRSHERGHGQAIVTENWDRTGGFNSKPLPKQLPSRKVETRNQQPSGGEAEADGVGDIERQASKGPSQTGKESTPVTVEMRAASPSASNAKNMLTPEQTEWMKAVLTALGIKNKRLEETLPKVTTRNYNGTLKHHVLGNIATVYADKRKANKPIIVAMRLENHEEPLPEFTKPEAWTVIPRNILVAAGINDLTEMFTRPELKPFVPNDDGVKYVPMPDEVREKLKGLAKAKGRR